MVLELARHLARPYETCNQRLAIFGSRAVFIWSPPLLCTRRFSFAYRLPGSPNLLCSTSPAVWQEAGTHSPRLSPAGSRAGRVMPAPTSTARIAGNTEQTMTYDEFIAQAPRYEPPTDFDAWLEEAERYKAESVVEADGYAGA